MGHQQDILKNDQLSFDKRGLAKSHKSWPTWLKSLNNVGFMNNITVNNGCSPACPLKTLQLKSKKRDRTDVPECGPDMDAV